MMREKEDAIGFIILIILIVSFTLLLFFGTKANKKAVCEDYSLLSGLETKYSEAKDECFFNVNGIWVIDDSYFEYLKGDNDDAG